jgi:hypothetical protein
MRGWTRASIVLGLLAAGAIATSIQRHDWIGGPIVAAVFAAAAVRCWRLGGE